ncbi:MAG: HAMP domain-containing protein [Clostridia bacterium]|nr:HAMP domain-containing protein [Clostridia bacterium]
MKKAALHKNRLFRRLLLAFVAAILATVLVLSLLMVVLVRRERTQALEAEVRVQARDVARLMQQFDSLSFWNGSEAISQTLNWKFEEIRANYGASVWLVNGNRRVLVLGDTDNAQEQLNDPDVLAQIYNVLSGREIRVQGLIPELGNDMVTIGVPWVNAYGYTAGAVLLHIPTRELSGDYRDLIRYTAIAGVIALTLGICLSYVIARRQTIRLNEISRAAGEFAGGDLTRRVRVSGDDEIAELGAAFNKMAEDLSRLEESRKSFVASVSHELRSPLTCIRGYVEGMLDGVIPQQDQARYLRVTLDETGRLTKLVNELLDLSRIESGEFSLNRTVFELNGLIAQQLFKFEQRIEEKQVHVEVSFAEDRMYVLADADRIRQVATNLIDNAVKFVDEGGTLTVQTRAVREKAEVSVINSGAVIPPDKLPMVFDRFYKVDSAHTSGKGSGLGLAITKRILEQHGQTIRVSSDSSGTRFAFTLELSAPPAQNANSNEQERGAP